MKCFHVCFLQSHFRSAEVLNVSLNLLLLYRNLYVLEKKTPQNSKLNLYFFEKLIKVHMWSTHTCWELLGPPDSIWEFLLRNTDNLFTLLRGHCSFGGT